MFQNVYQKLSAWCGVVVTTLIYRRSRVRIPAMIYIFLVILDIKNMNCEFKFHVNMSGEKKTGAVWFAITRKKTNNKSLGYWKQKSPKKSISKSTLWKLCPTRLISAYYRSVKKQKKTSYFPSPFLTILY